MITYIDDNGDEVPVPDETEPVVTFYNSDDEEL